MQTDPIGYKDNMNMYAYTGNDPVNKNDPSGLSGSSCKAESGVGNYSCDFFGDDDKNKEVKPPLKPDNSRAVALAKAKTRNGTLSTPDANKIRSVNRDRNLTVNVKAPVIAANKKTLETRGDAPAVALTNWSTYGGLHVRNVNGTPVLQDDSYDFRTDDHPGETFRNMETNAGGWVAGDGVDFNIRFEGSPIIVDTSFNQTPNL